jgi:restriction endonuclease
MDLNEALGQFDLVDANLRRLDSVWKEMRDLIPDGISFGVGDTESRRYEELRRAYDAINSGLPPIDGWRITDAPMHLNDIAQNRLDANDVGEAAAFVSVEEGIYAPDEALAEYRFRFNSQRQKLVRERVLQLIGDIDAGTAELAQTVERDGASVDDNPTWVSLRANISEVERLVGSSVRRKGRWSDLARHLAFAQGVDAHDIAEQDWPSVRNDIEGALYSEHEPLPVAVDDLATLAASEPHGPVSTALSWDSLAPDEFERLVFNIISDASGYENPKLLTRTNAPDRGRDLSVDRGLSDALSGVARQRVIVQCKHWTSKSVALADLVEAVAQTELWEPPPIDVLIIAASGRFTSDAVAWADRHNTERKRPVIELWAETHLESLLAERPHLATEFGLR